MLNVGFLLEDSIIFLSEYNYVVSIFNRFGSEYANLPTPNYYLLTKQLFVELIVKKIYISSVDH